VIEVLPEPIFDDKIVTAYISEITSLGEATIKFSTPMKNESVNTTHINSTVAILLPDSTSLS